MLSMWGLFWAVSFVTFFVFVYCFQESVIKSKAKKASLGLCSKQMDSGGQRAPVTSHIAGQLDSALRNLARSQRYLYGAGDDRQKFLVAFRTELAELESVKAKLSSFDNNINLQPATYGNTHTEDQAHNGMNLQETLNDVFPVLQKLTQQRGCKFTWEGKIDVDIALSQNFFTRMIRELVLNALMHNEPNNEICIKFGRDESHLHVELMDFGQGISQQTVDRIFDKRSDRHPKGRRQTDIVSHIDLSLIQTVLRHIGGNISVVSALGYGTRVNVSIPIARDVNERPANEKVISSEVVPYSDILYLGGATSLEESFMEHIQRKHCVDRLSSAEQLISVTLDKLPRIIICYGYALSCDLLALMKAINYRQSASNTNVLCITEPLSNEQRCHLFEYEVRQVVELPVTNSAIELIIKNMLRDQKRTETRVAEAIADYTVAQVEDDLGDGFEQKFMQCLHSNYEEPAFSQEDCASQLFMSTRNLQRKIGTHVGSTFRDSLRRYRVAKAKELIMKGETVTNAGFMVGFSSPSYFAKCFKAELGYVPSMLSRRLGQG